MNEKQTAVDWLLSVLIGQQLLVKFPTEAFKQAKAIEKHQIVEAFDSGLTIKMDGEQYYSQTYNQ